MSSSIVLEQGGRALPSPGQALMALLTSRGAPVQPGSLSPNLWERVSQQAQVHRVHGLLLRSLRENGMLGAVPATILAALSATAAESGARWLQKKIHLVRLAEATALHGIALIVLKGAHLAAEVYPAPGLRPMGDIDLMVHAQDLQRASHLLQALGYVCHEPYDLARVLREGAELPVHVHADGTALDLHWNIEKPVAGFAIDLDGLWQRARPSACAPGLLALSVEDQLLHIALHTVFHHGGQTGMIAYFDALYLCRCRPIDWNAICSRAHQWQVQISAHAFLKVARNGFGADVPEAVLAVLESPAGEQAASLLLRSLTDMERQATVVANRLRPLDKLYRYSGSVSGAARLLFNALHYPRKDVLRFSRLPWPLSVLASYPARWSRVIRSLATSLIEKRRSAVFGTSVEEGLKGFSHKQQLAELAAPTERPPSPSVPLPRGEREAKQFADVNKVSGNS